MEQRVDSLHSDWVCQHVKSLVGKGKWVRKWAVLTSDHVLNLYKDDNVPQSGGETYDLSAYSMVGEERSKAGGDGSAGKLFTSPRRRRAKDVPTSANKGIGSGRWQFHLWNPSLVSLPPLRLSAATREEMEAWMHLMNKAMRSASVNQVQLLRTKSNIRTSRGVLRLYRHLYINVVEAKELPVMDVLTKSADPYCVLQVDGRLMRTPTIYKNNTNPFWSDEHDVELFDPKAILVEWYDLNSPPKTHVSGDVYVCITHDPTKRHIEVKVVRARNLAVADITGSSDPFAVVTVGGREQKTSVVKENLHPEWNETFSFTYRADDDLVLDVSVFDWDRIGRPDELGCVKINFAEMLLHEDWYLLYPRSNAIALSGRRQRDRGRVRLKLKLSESVILPGSAYQELADFAVIPKPLVIKVLSKAITKNKESAAKTVINVFVARKMANHVLNYITAREVLQTASAATIFRGNTLATKAVDYYQKLVGMTYMQRTLESLVHYLWHSGVDFELDPNRLKDTKKGVGAAPKNAQRFAEFMTRLWGAIQASLSEVPDPLKVLYGNLRTMVRKQFPDEETVEYIVISGFFFLRLICPAILNPKLFGLAPSHPSKETGRRLTLVAKTLQNLANLQTFSQKEPFMGEHMNHWIESNMDSMRTFLDALSTVEASPTLSVEEHNLFGEINPSKDLQVFYETLQEEREAMAAVCKRGVDVEMMQQLGPILDKLEEQHERAKSHLKS